MRKGWMLLLTAAVLCCMCATAFAHDVPDLTRTGALNVSMRFEGEPVAGGTLTIFRAGDIHEDDGDFSFVLSEEFAGSGEALDDIDSPELAKALAEYADAQELRGTSRIISDQGEVRFAGLEPGLYLVVQDTAAEGYNPAPPFLVSVPMMKDGVYVYDVDASPKVGLERAPEPSEEPDEPGGKLPQTGQMNWPVPVMASTGVLLFICGWILRFRRETDAYES